MDQLPAQIHYISAQLLVKLTAQETAWVEDTVQTTNVCATKASQELIAV